MKGEGGDEGRGREREGGRERERGMKAGSMIRLKMYPDKMS